MNPEQLRKKLSAGGIAGELQGEAVILRKIGARDGMALAKVILSLPVNELKQPTNAEDMATFYALALSKSIASEDGSLPFDSDDGRAALEAIPLGELVPLAEKALQYSGMAGEAEAKKNLTPPSDSSPNSAEHSESLTPTNC